MPGNKESQNPTGLPEQTDTVVVGGGQAGLAMSEHLSAEGVPHIVLERDRIAERWRTGRWDSLVANGPAWHDRLPSLEFSGVEPDAFPGKEQVADYFVQYAAMIDAPIRTGVEVVSVKRNAGRFGFRIETSTGSIDAAHVVAATGPFQRPVLPPIVPETPGVKQLHSRDYRNPGQLDDGAVLVIGAGSSGVQIADEIMTSGRRTFLSVGPHNRPPRSYRGYDYVWWLGVLGEWDAPAVTPGMEHVTIAVSGCDGGKTIDFRRLAHQGMHLLGMADTFNDGVLSFLPDLVDNVAFGDANYLSVLDRADAFVERYGLDLPLEPEARVMDPDPECITNPTLQLDLAREQITTIIWATGYTLDYSWLQVDALDDDGRPDHHRGVSSAPGVYFLGLPWLTRRASSFIYGVWHDAKYLADHIVSRRGYLAYPQMPVDSPPSADS